VRFVRSALISSAVIAPVVALAGCQSNPSTAAYVGDQTVSTKQLQHDVNQGYTNAAIKASWSQGDYRQQVLQNQITHVLLQRAAQSTKVTVANTEGPELLQQLKAHIQGGASELNAELVKQGVAPSQQASHFQDVALAGQLAVKRGMISAYQIGLIELPTQAAANKVAQQLQTDESQYAAIAAKHPGQNTVPQPTSLSSLEFAQSFGPQNAAAARSHTSFVLQVPQSTSFAAVHVFSVDQPLSEMPATARVSLLQEGYSQLAPALLKKPGVKIRVNPRFGSWNAKQGKVDGAVSPAVMTSKPTASKSPQTSQ
jgi:peptidyl-prolyl cis-trans isomerase SurA